ncbi:Six-hairpin glycosidase-like protein [Xanthomonas bonasiae]|uniref:Six-hairpin glycosidase-like protein n=1 Tax=Xanthomonas bonasiae TaxID=2810351 RepID=UPI0019816392|nr:Six-hairpin glycosidase-like protein [Xanthomonas bonasiae]MBN6114181.1 Six-hairpin glycosidase-like protein [Xanthomonas bonasiae]
MLKMICLAATLGAAVSASAWQTSLQWRGQTAQAAVTADGGFVLRSAQGTRTLAAQPLRSDTASPLFDALFALAQQELRDDQVDAIRDPAFDHGKPLLCDCYQTGERWPYVWTRDVSYAADLALARLDPQRTRRSLRFKLSAMRGADALPGLFVAQDTGSGGSWPVSSDRVVWFLAARHLLDDAQFAADTRAALDATLTQDRAFAFDPRIGLYRGETSFLDWREQTYPAWTRNDVRFIAESFALSTNVLHYQALRLGERLAREHGDTAVAARYAGWADALQQAIAQRFWREDRGTYVSYLGSAAHPVAYESYDLLGLSLAVLADVLPGERARQALARYPAVEAGSPVVWPQQRDVPIYHNRAIWPFVSAYALRAARHTDDSARIAFEVRSLLRGAALAGSNMENYEFLSQAAHVDDGPLSGPVVNSPRQLWSVAGYLAMVIEGVFGVEDDGTVAPKLPVGLVPMLFGERDEIALQLRERRIVLRRPAQVHGDLLVAGDTRTHDGVTTVQLVARDTASTPVPLLAAADAFAPLAPPAPRVERDAQGWRVAAAADAVLYVDGQRQPGAADGVRLPLREDVQCLSLTRRDAHWESLHSPTVCIGDVVRLRGPDDWRWTAPRDGEYRLSLRYVNAHGPINTGVTAAVKQLQLQCGDAAPQRMPVVMPHSVGEQESTAAVFTLKAGQACRIRLAPAANMSALQHFARYTGGQGGADGVVNAADVAALLIAPAGAAKVSR